MNGEKHEVCHVGEIGYVSKIGVMLECLLEETFARHLNGLALAAAWTVERLALERDALIEMVLDHIDRPQPP